MSTPFAGGGFDAVERDKERENPDHSVRPPESLPGQRDQSHPYLVQRQPASQHVRRKNLGPKQIRSVSIGAGVYPFNWGGRYVPDYDLNRGALNYVQTALSEVGLGQTKANIVHCAAELIPNITKPLRPPSSITSRIGCPSSCASCANTTHPSRVAPIDGYPGASADNAERYYKHLLPMVTSNKGSPKRSGAPIDVFINSLADEPKQRIGVLAPFDRHWGIYRLNGKPKFKVSLSAQGQYIYLTTVKGIMRMPQRWCVFNRNSTDKDKVRRQVECACTKGDCTTLATAASCSNLGFVKNASYAFNVYFQTYFQHEKACDFKGLSYITDQDPSTEDCLFPSRWSEVISS
ncbi:hypothetical protein SASPL_108186 [Salvia splendens]|uniref:X8 domain-containing protein n=1 Tax=Salvia splendens TaxID=180675 RepID=A0A8X9A806_SALSN|nr:hypothetical protein SASPL_108186 [Salvia splendens]